MARAGKAHTSEDIWHLSIDDLLAAPKEPARLAGGGPFVINLSTSTASIGPPPKGVRSFDGLHVYQLRRGPEGQPQFLLRLGIITTEVEADAILSGVLEHYPGATKDLAEDDDRAAVVAKVRPAEPPKAAQPPPEKPPEAQRPPPNAAPSTPAVAAKPEAPVRWDIDELLPDLPVTRPSLAAEATPSTEIEFSAPAPAKAAPTRGGFEEIDHDPDAITHEVEITAFVFEAPTIEAHELDVITLEALAAEVTATEAPTIEAHELDAIMFETSTTEAKPAEAPTIEAYALELLAAETPPALEPADNELHAAAPAEDVPAFLPDTQAPLDDVPVVAAAPALALADEPIAITASSRAPVENVPVVLATEAGIGAASAPKPSADSGTLEQLVAKISALVESAHTHDKDAVSPQNLDSAIARRAEWPSPPRVPAVEPAPVDAPSIDSTQTTRALTPLELADDQASQWFSIQLALSEEHIDPEHVPSLDIFNEYRLYSVTGLDQDRVMHALRMGFFSSELAAEAVAGYLRGFFDSPCIKRVSLAECERFAERAVTARKDIGETGLHAVIELTAPTLRPERRTQVSDSGKRRAPTSIWSRLVAPLKR